MTIAIFLDSVICVTGVPFTAVHGSVRFSFSRCNTGAEMDCVLNHMPRIMRRLRDLSPFVK